MSKDSNIINNNELKEYSSLMKNLLINRGIDTDEKANIFLNPDYARDINNPFLILNMECAVLRIISAIDKKEKIIIYGDYDCDGIPGSVVLYDFFKKINFENFENYIPHRHKEGYGLNIGAIDEFSKQSVQLIITVDCGISDMAEISHAQKIGIDVIVTDHHTVPVATDDKYLPAYTILNSKQKDDKYPDDMLCGAGLAWKLVQALLKKGREIDAKWANDIPEGWEKWLLDMAGLSTIADMVPLQKENRAIAYFGLRVLRKSPRPGLLKLLHKMKMNQQYLTEDDIGFMIAPRINAASRMDIPMRAFTLLSTDDDIEAGKLSEHLHNINDERKWIVASIVKEVKKELKQREIKKVVVIGNPKWSVGVLGIVASKIVEEYDRPAFVWGRGEGEVIKGSCRSNGTVDVVKLMRNTDKDLFLDTGGHEFAGGFSITNEKIHKLEKEIIDSFDKVKTDKRAEKSEDVDAKLGINDVVWDNYNQIERLSPFGVGNKKPTFLFENIEIDNVAYFGKEKNHIRLDFKNSKAKKISAIGFFMQEDMFEVPIGSGVKINLIATMEKSMFRNFPELRLRIVDIQ